MASGKDDEWAPRGNTRVGRTIKPTEKGQAILNNQLERRFWKSLSALDSYSDELKLVTGNCPNPTTFKDYLLTWMTLYNEVKVAEEEMKRYLPKERIRRIKPDMQATHDRCIKVKMDAYAYLSTLTLDMHSELRQTSRNTSKVFVDAFKSESQKRMKMADEITRQMVSVQQEIENVQNELSQIKTRSLIRSSPTTGRLPTVSELTKRVSSPLANPQAAELKPTSPSGSQKGLIREEVPICDNLPRQGVQMDLRQPPPVLKEKLDNFHIPIPRTMSNIEPTRYEEGHAQVNMESTALDNVFNLPQNLEPLINSPVQKKKVKRIRTLAKEKPIVKIPHIEPGTSSGLVFHEDLNHSSPSRRERRRTSSPKSNDMHREYLTEREIQEDMMAWRALQEKYAVRDTLYDRYVAESVPRAHPPCRTQVDPPRREEFLLPTVNTPPHLQDPRTLPPEVRRTPAYVHADNVKNVDAVKDSYVSKEQFSKPVDSSVSVLTPTELINQQLATAISQLALAVEGKEKSSSEASKERDKPKLPTLEPSVFQGEILNFHVWLNSFITLVESRIDDPLRRLFYLEKYTDGPAKKAIRELLDLTKDETAYERAIAKLKERFGSPMIVATTFKRKLKSWPVIKCGDAKALQDYADFISHCKTAMASIQYLSILEEPDENKKMADKLPPEILCKWNRKISKKMYPDSDSEEKPGYPSFKQFCTFLAREARIASGPCAPTTAKSSKSKVTLATETKSSDEAQRKSAPAQNTASGGGTSKKKKVPSCLVCNDKHWIQKCPKFLALTPTQRQEYCTKNVICYGCLRKDHDYKDCRFRKSKLLYVENDKNETSVKGSNASEVGSASVTTHATFSAPNTNRYTSVLPVYISHQNKPDHKILIYALIDSQSDGCFIKESVVNQLGVQGYPVDLSIKSMGQQTTESCSGVVGLRAKGIGFTDMNYDLPVCYTKNHIPANRNSFPRPEIVKNWPHLAEIAKKLHPYDEDLPVGVLLGYNCDEAVFPAETIRIDPKQPWGIQTPFGWTVCGPVTDAPEENMFGSSSFCFKTCVQECNISEIKKMFDLEFSGIDTDERKSYEDTQFVRMMEAEFRIDETGHVELPLPVREGSEVHRFSQGSRRKAFRRFMSLKRQLLADSKLLKAFSDFFTNMFSLNQAEKAPPLKPGDLFFWFLPIQVVYHPRKPDKPRVVYDGSSEVDGVSLNSMLLTGPDLTNSLLGVLLRFRADLIAMLCDIKGMFHQVKVSERWRNLLRFFWFKNNDPNDEIIEYRVTVHLFGAASSPACATFALQKLAEVYEAEYGSDVAAFIRKFFYVDDGLKSEPTDQRVIDLFLKSRQLCSNGGFQLHQFASNSSTVLESVPSELYSKELSDWKPGQPLPDMMALGMHWSMQLDCFFYLIKVVTYAYTRRGLLSAVGTVYDPLGLISPVTLKGRLILQDLCLKKLSWDEVIDSKAQEIFDEWYIGLRLLENLRIPRCYKRHVFDVDLAELHVFCDGSDQGYGNCSYLVLEDEDHNRDVSLVMGKARVKPAKKTTTPRLELQAAVLAAKVSSFLVEELPKYERLVIYMWSDSMIILAYISNVGTRYRIYVANRVQAICDRTQPRQWGYVSTDENPADLASRGCDASELLENELWFRGPKFLSQTIVKKDETYELPEDDPEVYKEKTILNTISVEWTILDILERLKRISSWYRMIRIILLWRKYFIILRKKAQDRKLPHLKGQYPKEWDIESEVEERRKVQLMLIRMVQIECFPTEYAKLVPGYPTSLKECKERNRLTSSNGRNLKKLDVFLCPEEQVLKVGGRLRRADLPLATIHPIILPKFSCVTTAIVTSMHEYSAHSGRYSTIHLIRSVGWWIINIRSSVDHVLRNCVTCKKLRGKITEHKMSDLPNDRLEIVPAFTYCGVDFFGPFYVREKRSMVKRWACLFCCLVIRAVHVEICNFMTTDSFLMAYRRFVDRRGPIRSLRCDRGSNLMGARGELDLEVAKLDQATIRRHLLEDDCDWVTVLPNPPKASHMGGVWERLIGSVRRNFEALLTHHGHLLTDESLRTLATEAEALVNDRPLTYVDLSTPEEPQAISPSMLLTMKRKKVLPPLKENMTREDRHARNLWIRVQYLADLFWDKWKRDYLPIITERTKWHKQSPNLRVGDIVLLVDENSARNTWPMARIISTKESEDGVVRTIMVKTKDGLYCRPVRKVVLLYRRDVKDD